METTGNTDEGTKNAFKKVKKYGQGEHPERKRKCFLILY